MVTETHFGKTMVAKTSHGPIPCKRLYFIPSVHPILHNAQIVPQYPRTVLTSWVITASCRTRGPGKGVWEPPCQPAPGKPLHEAVTLERVLVTNSPRYSLLPAFLVPSSISPPAGPKMLACVPGSDDLFSTPLSGWFPHGAFAHDLSVSTERTHFGPPLGPMGPGRAFPIRPLRLVTDAVGGPQALALADF